MAVTSEARDEQTRPAGDQLAWERAFGPRVGLAALGAAACVVGSFALQISVLRHSKDEAQYLHSVLQHASSYEAGGVLQFLALLFLVLVLWYLYRASKYRRPQTPRIAIILGIAGPVALGVVAVISPFVAKHYASEFAALPQGLQNVKHAKDLLKGGGTHTLGIIALPAGLAFAFAMIMTNVNVMRAGLVSTFLGIIGVIAGLLYVIPLGPPQILLFFWLGAIGVVVLDRWPGGRGPAWATGEAVKWPSAMERRAQMAGGRQQVAGTRPQATGNGPEPEPEPETDAQPTSPSRTSRKRKRKQGRKH